MRGAKWRQHGTEPLLRHLDRRATDYANRTGGTPYEVGDINALFRIREIARQLKPDFRTSSFSPDYLPPDARRITYVCWLALART
jgi:hypothetical protein